MTQTQWDISRHGQTNLWRKWGCLREEVQVPECKRQHDRLLHLNGDGFLLLVHVSTLRKLNVT